MNKKTKVSDLGYEVFIDSGMPYHNWIYTKKTGIEIPSDKVIHHIDGDKLNNDIKNLILISKIDHNKLEKWIRKTKNRLKIMFISLWMGVFSLYIYQLQSKVVHGFYFYLAVIFFILGVALNYFPKISKYILRKSGFFRKNY